MFRVLYCFHPALSTGEKSLAKIISLLNPSSIFDRDLIKEPYSKNYCSLSSLFGEKDGGEFNPLVPSFLLSKLKRLGDTFYLFREETSQPLHYYL